MTRSSRSAAASPARVKALVTPSGIAIWHVEDYTVPVVSVEFAFEGGAVQDPEGRCGLANLMTGLLDEGAGPLDADAFQEALEERAIELSFDAARDRVEGSLRTLAENAGRAFELLGLALTAPRFEAGAIDRVKSQIIAGIRRDEHDPQTRARDTLYRIGYAGHSYGRPVDGQIEDLQRISREDILAQHQRLFGRNSVKIVAVGAISEKQLIDLVESAFGSLPANPQLVTIARARLAGAGTREIVDLDVPQSTLYYALEGLERHDPDFMAASVMNHVLGAGSFTSRLWTEVREKRGLAYSVWSMLAPKRHGALFLAGTATSNDRMAESLEVIGKEISRMAAKGPSAAELEKAKAYLVGSFALRFDTSRKIANHLLDIWFEDLGIEYIDRRNAEVAAVTLEDCARAAKRLLAKPRPLVVVAGRPVGL